MSHSVFYPTIQGAPGIPVQRNHSAPAPQSETEGAPTAFSAVLDQALERPGGLGLKFSAHAAARVQSRKLDVSAEQMQKLHEAVNRAAAKGLDDTLILMPDAAFIVSVKNRTIVTALDRKSLEGNVFTNIDGAVIA